MKWTEQEDNIIKQYYPEQSYKGCIAFLPHRTRSAIQHRASKLRVRNDYYYTEEQITYLRTYAKRDNKTLAAKFGKSVNSIKATRSRLDLGSVYENAIDKYSLVEIGLLVGKSKSNISKIWLKHGLKYRKVGKYKLVSKKNLVDFMLAHENLWCPKDCEEWFFNEFEWFRERKKREFDKMVKERWGSLSVVEKYDKRS